MKTSVKLPTSLLFPGNAAVEKVDIGTLFDERWGVVLQMGFDPLPSWEPQIQVVTARLSRELLPDGSDTLRQRLVSGHSLDRQRALDSAIGEAIERVFGGFSGWTGYGQTVPGLPMIDLQWLPQFSKVELKHLDSRYGRPAPERLVACYPATHLATRECYRAPAQMVFCPYHPGSREKLFWEPTANGLAAGREAAAADVAGLLEVIERDALAVSWLLQIPGLELSPEDALGEEYAATMYAVLRGGVEARLALVSLDIPLPICVAAIYDQSSMPCVSFGAAARTDVRSAAKKALCEAALARYTMKLAIALLVGEPSCELACYDPKTYQEHGLAWARPENAVQTTWVFGNRAVSCHELEASHMPPGEVLNYVVELVGAAGYPVYSCDLSTPELATAGWAVHRLLVPGLQPLNPGRYRRMLRSERLSKVHRWLGQNGSCYKISDFIHPFC